MSRDSCEFYPTRKKKAKKRREILTTRIYFNTLFKVHYLLLADLFCA